MKTRIPVTDLQLGMFIHKLGGSWLKHPFLRGSFLLTDTRDLMAIRECGIQDVWIDPSQGQVVDTRSRLAADAQAPSPPTTPEPDTASRPSGEMTEGTASSTRSSPGPTSITQEIERAKRICLSAKSQVKDMLQAARLGKAIDAGTTQLLVREIAASVERQPVALLSVARLKTHDDYTYMHSVAVCALMIAMARQLGFDDERTRLAGVGGLMHDLGKAAMPLDVLNKPGRLTDAEFSVMRSHTVAGANMLRSSGADSTVVDIALHHHEKIDGTGYPHKLPGARISELARMGAICDVYDAVTSQRAYKEAWNPAEAMRQMAKWEGHFDKQLFSAFVKSVGIYPVGSLVRLASQRLAIVLAPGAESLLTPVVRVFFSLRSEEQIPVQTIDLAAPNATDRIVGPEDPSKWGFPGLEDLWLK
ncbi:HD-GYP domain-containing protein [Roseateles sp. DAIF2]|uniref:HD-GYP domain-containing protein n=1 Tax=Roseateles sp. DAIF2 TaxID=2714952 RepID=UPI0018A2A8A5|nr:HD-GYP domain-containing protein [Roseateles sp. DAIF2]QPF73878.1 HD-GYP domain-containing protein [Roseateles sp. DAIF2]